MCGTTLFQNPATARTAGSCERIGATKAPVLSPAFFFVLEKAVKSAGNAVIPTFPMHRSHGLQGSLKRRYKHPSPTSINGYHTAKKLLSQSPAKRPTFAFADESGYTLAFANRIAHSGLHAETGAFRTGPLSLPSERSARSQTSPGRVSERRTLPLLGLGHGCSQRTQRAFGTAMRLCASLFRGVAAPLGCVICLQLGDVAVFSLCAQGLSVCARRGVVSLPSARFTCC